ncbi:hypothetical protein E5676_scaffold1112G00610 [Cucumis melo var. makuwa]|uniref:Uncharacterized protein n=1 Tax=Cucumis melo var. makuwa TaxID=1194695 RepID=A0A5A7SLD0_CUCMM|nr:hypothetical protein E6C27_scaffold417G00750 [Cucumis melo var. makuwa]TYK00392.1 hypothetical protein E5676_scaffold1112G00610 [Cucumis melo var. makuwa]
MKTDRPRPLCLASLSSASSSPFPQSHAVVHQFLFRTWVENTVRYVVVFCLDIGHGVLSWKDGVSFGITRRIRASFGITRLIRASFGIMRLMCAFYGTTRLLCRVRVQRGADRREAGRMREGHMDASGFLYASADIFC